MKINQLKTLVCISDCGSFQEAARVLHISQPSLSKCIKELESELGVLLLVRSHRGITLTTYGKALLVRARLILEEVRRAREEIEKLKGCMDGQITIGISPAAPTDEFIECFSQFRLKYPDVKIKIEELRPDKLAEGLREGRLDLALASHAMPGDMEGFNHVHLFSQPAVLALPMNHWYTGNCLSELRELYWMLPDEFADSPLADIFKAKGLPPPANVLTCASLVMYSELAARNDVVSLWSRNHLAKSSRAHTRLKLLEIPDFSPAFHYSLVCRDMDILSREAAILAEYVIFQFYGNRQAPSAPAPRMLTQA